MPTLTRIGAAVLALGLMVATAPAFADPTTPAHVTVHHTVHHVVHHVHHAIHTVKATAPVATAAQAPSPAAPKP